LVYIFVVSLGSGKALISQLVGEWEWKFGVATTTIPLIKVYSVPVQEF
jgi:hypothetical protein